MTRSPHNIVGTDTPAEHTVKSPMDMELFKSSVAAFLMALTIYGAFLVSP